MTITLLKPSCKSALLIAILTTLSAPSMAGRVVDTSNTKSVGPVVWHKQAAINADQLIAQSIPQDQVSLFFIRAADADVSQTSVNIAVNNRFQVSLQPGNYTQVYSCAGVNHLSAVITGKKSNNLIKDANVFNLAPNAAYFFYVEVDEQGQEKIQQITEASAKEVLATKQYQQHQISRVVSNCPIVVTSPVAPISPVVKHPELLPEPTKPQKVSIDLKILFDNDKSVINPDYYQEVKEVADFLNQYPSAHAVIEGHTDNRGNSGYNQKLSQRRADAVKQLLESQFGIKAERLTATGYGDANPVASNETAEGRAKNRRVVAVIETR